MNDLEHEQKFLVNLLISNAAPQQCIDSNLTENFFKYAETKWIYKIAMWHYKQYRSSLQSDSLQSILGQSKTISDPLKKQISIMFEVIKGHKPVTNFPLLITEFFQYYKDRLFKQTMQKSLN